MSAKVSHFTGDTAICSTHTQTSNVRIAGHVCVGGNHRWPMSSDFHHEKVIRNMCGYPQRQPVLWRVFMLWHNHVSYLTFMMTSSNGNIFRVTGPLCGEPTGQRWIPLTKVSDAELWCFVWSGPERFSKQSRRRWFETPSRSLWRNCNAYPRYDIVMYLSLPYLTSPYLILSYLILSYLILSYLGYGWRRLTSMTCAVLGSGSASSTLSWSIGPPTSLLGSSSLSRWRDLWASYFLIEPRFVATYIHIDKHLTKQETLRERKPPSRLV